jgi:hypothetical protein
MHFHIGIDILMCRLAEMNETMESLDPMPLIHSKHNPFNLAILPMRFIYELMRFVEEG